MAPSLQVIIRDEVLRKDSGVVGNPSRVGVVRGSWTGVIRNKLKAITNFDDDARIRELLGPVYLPRVERLKLDQHMWSPDIIYCPEVYRILCL